ncbi:rod shape-determining protein MreD [Elongatibacter sediminis]|uniref:Rod shape-determining protein MreD n=1 Tax=Elongatibacter sediminis TaxID=3119006 RepID=A0AAW9RHG2_9GAMM
MNANRDRYGPILITLVVAMVLTIVPLPAMVQPLRPYWVALVLVYWCLETQDMVGLGGAFATGLILDLLTGSLLGMHGLTLVILVYLVTRFRARLRFFPPWQQALSVLALLINDRIVVLWIIGLRGDPFPPVSFWLAPVVGTFLWPWIFLLLDRYRGRARQRSTV